MEVTVKVRFNASKERIEKFASDRYLMYLPFEEDGDTAGILISLLSKYMGVPPGRIEFKRLEPRSNDKVFEVS